MDTANGQFNGTAQFAFLQRVDLEHALPKMDSVVTDASCVVTDASCMARVQKGMLSRIEGILGGSPDAPHDLASVERPSSPPCRLLTRIPNSSPR